MTGLELASKIEHTILKPETTADQVGRVCDEAIEYGFFGVCVNPSFVAHASSWLAGSRVVVVSVAGFPLGASVTATKVDEARRAIDDGAREIDMVVRLGPLISADKSSVRDDIAAVADVVHGASPRHLLKVILETAVLTPGQIAFGCRCVAEAQADFVKTSTGFHPQGGADLDAVRTLRRFAAPIRVKAAGGIRDLETALAMCGAGADRLGMSASVAVIKQLNGP